MNPQTGLIVARPGLVREGLQAVLSAIRGVDALEPADDGDSALKKIQTHQPCLVILDASLSEDEVGKTLGQIKKERPGVRSIVVVENPQHKCVMKTLGADAVLIEGFSAELLAATIKALLA